MLFLLHGGCFCSRALFRAVAFDRPEQKTNELVLLLQRWELEAAWPLLLRQLLWQLPPTLPPEVEVAELLPLA